jgi:hypothetical protein
MRENSRDSRRHANERLRVILAATLTVAALATFVWGGISGAALHYVGGLLLLLAASVGGFDSIAARAGSARLRATRAASSESDQQRS